MASVVVRVMPMVELFIARIEEQEDGEGALHFSLTYVIKACANPVLSLVTDNSRLTVGPSI